MRKVLPVSLAVLLIVLVGAYCIAWFSQANAIKQSIAQTIDELHAKQIYITYDTIEMSGFPSDVFVSIVKPHFAGRVDMLLKSLNAGKNTDFATLPEWDEEVTIDGRIMFGVNALSNHYSLAVSGVAQETGKIGEQPIATTYQPSGDVTCALQLDRSSGLFDKLWNFQLAANDAQTFLKEFRLLDCNAPAHATSDSNTHEQLASGGPVRLYISNIPQGSQQQMRVYVKLADFEVTPQGDKIMAVAYQAFSPGAPFPPKWSVYGKQNAELDFSYTGPADWSHKPSNMPIDIALSKFDITNQIYDSHMTFHLSDSTNGPDRLASLSFKTQLSASEQYDALLQEGIRNFIQRIYDSKDPRYTNILPFVQKYTPDQLYAIIAPVIPNVHSLGKLVMAMDGGARGNPDFSTGDFTLNDLEFSASPYGITGNGSANRIQGQPLPTGKLTLICTNCLHMIDDMAAYQSRLQKTVSYFDANKAAAMTVDPQLVEGAKNFLIALNQPAQGGENTTFTYTIVSNGAAGSTVNGKRMDEVMALFNQYIAPALKKPDQQTPQPSQPPQK